MTRAPPDRPLEFIYLVAIGVTADTGGDTVVEIFDRTGGEASLGRLHPVVSDTVCRESWKLRFQWSKFYGFV